MTSSPYKGLTLCVQMYIHVHMCVGACACVCAVVYTCSCVWEHVHVCVQRFTPGIFLDCPPLSLLRQDLFLSPSLASLATQHALGIPPHLSFLSEGLQAGYHTPSWLLCAFWGSKLWFFMLAQQVLYPLSHRHSPGPTLITNTWGPGL